VIIALLAVITTGSTGPSGYDIAALIIAGLAAAQQDPAQTVEAKAKRELHTQPARRPHANGCERILGAP
jgi:hypothetical protein